MTSEFLIYRTHVDQIVILMIVTQIGQIVILMIVTHVGQIVFLMLVTQIGQIVIIMIVALVGYNSNNSGTCRSNSNLYLTLFPPLTQFSI